MLTRLFVISLSTATRRRELFQQRADTTLDWEFFDASTGLANSLNYSASRALRKGGRHLTPTELGCYSSHFRLWQQLISDEEADRYIIFEDDVMIDWRFFERLVSSPETAPWPLLHFHYSITAKSRKLKPSPGTWFDVVELLDYGFGATAYQVRKEGARRLVTALSEVNLGVDMAMEQAWVHCLRNLSVFPFPVLHPVGPTQMDGERWDEAPKPPLVKIERALRRSTDALRRTIWNVCGSISQR